MNFHSDLINSIFLGCSQLRCITNRYVHLSRVFASCRSTFIATGIITSTRKITVRLRFKTWYNFEQFRICNLAYSHS